MSRIYEPDGYDPSIIYNGCGPDIIQKIPFIRRGLGPDSFFNKSCQIHDFQYSLDDKIPESESKRKEADELFLSNMLAQAESENWFRKILRKAEAYLFYWSVRTCGKLFYKKREG